MRTYYVYILASTRRRLYVGVTNDLIRRLWEHRHGTQRGHARHYRIDKLVHHEQFSDVRSAIAREKEIKRFRRERKERLVTAHNAGWLDLSEDWMQDGSSSTVDPGCSTRPERRSCPAPPAAAPAG
jgi:putative endonuclease